MEDYKAKNLEIIDYDFDSFFLFHNNITMDGYDKHYHNAVEIIMPITNAYEVIVNDISFLLNELDIIVIPAGKEHEIIAPSKIGQRVILQFDVAGISVLRGLADVFYIYSIQRIINAEKTPDLHSALKTLLMDMLDEYLLQKPYYQVSIANKIIELTLLLARFSQHEPQADENLFEHKDKLARFQKCIDYIHSHYMENMPLERVAKSVSFSKFHFSRWFQQLAGATFNEYLIRLRLSKAETILLSSSKSITEVAMDVGFQSTTTFNRIFKKYNQCTPTEYRHLNHRYNGNDVANSPQLESKQQTPLYSYPLPEPAKGALSIVYDGGFKNPFLWADVPDPSVIRVGNTYYMTSTTMYFNPGCPIMRSTDLINWEIVNYAYDILDDSDSNCLRGGAGAYGKGSWASSLRFHKGVYYIAVASFTTNKTYIFQTFDIENGPWRRYTLDGVYHDSSLFFEDNDRVYLIYKAETIRIIELTNDATAIKPGGLNQVLVKNTEVGGTGGLAAEGAHFYKINGKYYLFLISWPPAETSYSGSGRRLQLCYRADSLTGSYRGNVVLDDGMARPQNGVAQGGIVDTPTGDWYAMLFQDHGPVGRIPVLVPIRWIDDWPAFGIYGQVPRQLPLPASNGNSSNDGAYPITISDEFYPVNSGKPFHLYAAENDWQYSYTHLLDNNFEEVVTPDSEEKQLLENRDFAEELQHWSQKDIATLSTIPNEANLNKFLLVVEDRVTTRSGPQQNISGKLKPGGIYEVKARVLYTTGIANKNFIISIQTDDNVDSIINVGFGRLSLGEWGIITGTFTAPAFLTPFQKVSIFIETPWEGKPRKEVDLIDYYVEYISLIEKPVITLTHTLPGENEPNGSRLLLPWQFNHNPDNNNWSLNERPGFLRLKSSYLCQDLLSARNTLTQRSFGPTCSGVIALETHGLKDGDTAGLCALQADYGYVAVTQKNSLQYLVMVNSTGKDSHIVESILLEESIKRIYLKLDFDFITETACFYYSLDEISWFGIGNNLDLTYKLDHFTGYRFALFYYATLLVGGFADFDYFRVSDNTIEQEEDIDVLNANMVELIETAGMHGIRFELPLRMEALPERDYEYIKFSMLIPPSLQLDNVDFCYENITGDVSYRYENERLEVFVTGDNVSFARSLLASQSPVESSDIFDKGDLHRVSTLFATFHFSVNGFVPETTTLTLRPDYLYAKVKNSGSAKYVIYRTHNLVTGVVLNYLETGAKAKIPGYANPLISHKFGADQSALVHNDRVYLYMTADTYEYDRQGRITNNTFRRIDKLTIISSTDFLNWTDHGEIKVTGVNGITHWATTSRKPAIACKVIDGKEKFFLYFSNCESNIGVLVADAPLGPWQDVLGCPFIHRGIPGVEDIPWCFDPAVLIDDDGVAYLYFGGGLPSESAEDALHPKTARVVQLGDDMISTRGRAMTIDAPAFYEAAGINKVNGKYYFSYCSNLVEEVPYPRPKGYPGYGEIAHMISSSPMGPFEYAGVILKNPLVYFGDGGNLHHCIFNFRNQWFITYHTQTLARAHNRAKGFRSPHINRLEFYGNGRIKPVAADREGVVLDGTINPYELNHANTFAWCSGVTTVEDEEGNHLTHIHNSDWIAIANVDFGQKGATHFIAYISSFVGGEIELRLDNPYGKYLGSIAVGTTGTFSRWEERSCEVKSVSGVHHLFLTFRGDSDTNLFDLKCWSFKPFV